MKTQNILGIALLALLVFSSCKEEDLELPVINSVAINGQSDEAEVEAGTSFTFTAEFADNINLKEYKIDIHDVFDGHAHNKTAGKTPWSFISIYDIAGEVYAATESISIPSEVAAGPYDVIVRVVDDAGNEGDFVEMELIITNADQAQINLQAPDFASGVNVNAGDTLALAGDVTDNIDIASIEILVENHATEAVIYDQDFDLAGQADLTWDFSELNTQNLPVVIPAGTEAGEYELKVTVTDSDGNITLLHEEFEVL